MGHAQSTSAIGLRRVHILVVGSRVLGNRERGVGVSRAERSEEERRLAGEYLIVPVKQR